MRQINLESVQEAGNFERLPAGGYICRITKVDDIPINPQTGKGDYLFIEFDIAEGEFKDYYTNLEKSAGFWGGKFIRSYKPAALPMFKRMCNAVSKSNPPFIFDGGKVNADEETLVGKYIGLVLGEEEYMGNDGSVKTRLYASSEYELQDIRAGKFKVPKFKELKPDQQPAPKSDGGFVNIPDGIGEEVPFS